MKAPRISIVTPSYNQAAYLEQAIASVLDQSGVEVEHIVVDGSSTDGSVEILRRHSPSLARWISESDSGQTEALNKGFAMASGEFLGWLNADDVYRPGALRQAVEFLTDHPEVGMVYGDADYIDPQGKVIGRFPAAQTSHRGLRRGYVHIPQQAAFFRSAMWRQVGPLDPSFYFAMDYDLWVRISHLAPIRYVRRTWAGFRLHVGAKTWLAADRCWPEMMRVHRRLGGGRFSIIYAKYLTRRLVEPILPLRLRARLWRQSWALSRTPRA
jgi:glycosyltransferase involved in cell wall biosynthesis